MLLVSWQVHTPFEHVWSPGQVCPQAPQCSLSDAMAVQVPVSTHHFWPAGHPQAEALHCSPGWHEKPQTPQFASSVARSTQAAPHGVIPSDVHWHVPDWQPWPLPQLNPH